MILPRNFTGLLNAMKSLTTFQLRTKKTTGEISLRLNPLGQAAREQAFRGIMLTSEGSSDVSELDVLFEEADHRILSHIFYQANQGSTNLCIYSSDTGVAVALLHPMPLLKLSTLAEVWMKAGRGETHRTVPLHKIHARNSELCKALPAIHNLTSVDTTSKVGTNKGGLKAPTELLT